MIVEQSKETRTNANGLTEVYYLPFKWNIAHLDIIRRRSLNFTVEWRLEMWGNLFCANHIARKLEICFQQFLSEPNHYLKLTEATS